MSQRHFAILGTAALLVAIQIPVAAEDTVYVIKQERPSSGSNIRREVVKAGSIPLDKTYAELTPEQKAWLKSQYQQMGPNDEPPYPLRGLRPLYTSLARAHEGFDLKYKGELMVYVNVDSSGAVNSISVAKSPDEALSQAVANFMTIQKFKPALCSGAPCAQVFPFHAELIGPEIREMTSANPASGVDVRPRE